MGNISDIVSAIKDVVNATSGTMDGISNTAARFIKPRDGSISAMALQGTANFSVLVPDDLDLEDDLMIARALEQRFSTFLLTVLTMNPYMPIDKGSVPTAQDYINKFHQNMGTKFDINTDPARKLFESVEVQGDVSLNEQLCSFVESADSRGIDYNCWITESLQIVSSIYEGVSAKGIDMENTMFNYTLEDVTEQCVLNDKGRAIIPITEAQGSSGRPPKIHRSGTSEKPINYMANNDLKKSNDSVPTLLHVRVYPYMKDTGVKLDPLDFVIGVKATLHQIASADMISNLASGLRNENSFFNFVRWTTGETKFFKDFLFAIDQQKMDAKNTSSSNGWWSALRRRKASSTLKKFVKGKTILPNTTIVCTVDILTELKTQYGFNLTGDDTSLIYGLMNKYFLLSFVRVDPALQRVDFLFDGNTKFETCTYSTLSKDIGRDDKKFKDMMRMLGRSA